MNRIHLKQLFLNSFHAKNYKIVPHAPLLPDKEIDLDEFKLTYRASLGSNWIMHQLRQGYSPFAAVQPVFRYHDYKRVGDGKHLALFEMGGTAAELTPDNKEKIYYDGLEFLVSAGIAKESLWATYFEGGEVKSKLIASQEFPADIDSFNMFKKFGIPEERIIGCGAEVAFVGLTREDPYGGPRAHIYFDRGDSYSCSGICFPEHDEMCNRFIEVAVFISEYLEKHLVQNQVDLSEFVVMTYPRRPFVVMGIGMERLQWVIHKFDDIYLTDPIFQLLQNIQNLLLGYSFTRIDLIKLIQYLSAVVFLIASGAKPGNRSNRRRQLRELLVDMCSFSNKIIEQHDIVWPMIEKIIDEYSDYKFLKEMSRFTDKVGNSPIAVKYL